MIPRERLEDVFSFGSLIAGSCGRVGALNLEADFG